MGIWRDLFIWWPFYALKFVAIESFFRGVLVLRLSKFFGSAAIFIAVAASMDIAALARKGFLW